MNDNENFIGENDRRKDTASVRLSLLERSYFENKDSLASVHRRVSEFKKEVQEDMRVGFNDLKETIKESVKGCVECKKVTDDRIAINSNRITRLEVHHGWLYAWLTGISAFLGWDKIK